MSDTRRPSARVSGFWRQPVAALRALLVLTVLLGVGYPLVILGVAQLPGLRGHADGSVLAAPGGQPVGSRLIGQQFVDPAGNALPQYFQTRPSNAGAGYDPTASGAGNLGPESVTDTLPDPANPNGKGKPALLSTVCTRSETVGQAEGVDGSRPYCTPGGLGAVLAVFHTGPDPTAAGAPVARVISVNEACPTPAFLPTYQGVGVECHRYGDDVSAAEQVLIRGSAPAVPAVPPDAVTASASGLDPDISPAYARLQTARVAAARHLPPDVVTRLVDDQLTGRELGFLGEPRVNVLALNTALDHPTAAP